MRGRIGYSFATDVALLSLTWLGIVGVLCPGLEVLGEGAILSGLIFAAIAVLTFFGFMHGPAVGIAVTPVVALAYAMLAGLLYACARQPVAAPVGAETAPAE